MWRFILLIATVAGAALGLLVYSQHREEPLHVSGFIEADEIRLGSRIGGRVAEVLVQEGQTVAPGQLLLRLDPFDLRERLAEANAILAARQAELARLEAGYRKEEKEQARAERDRWTAVLGKSVYGPRPQEIEAGKARVRAAESQLAVAKIALDRAVQLRRQDVSTEEALDRATDAWKSAQEDLLVRKEELSLLVEGTRKEEIAEARAQLAASEQRLALLVNGFRVEDRDAARAAVDAAVAARDAISRQLEELEIAAPQMVPPSPAGATDPPVHSENPAQRLVVDSVELQPGDLVAANAPVISIIDRGHLWVRAYVPENRLALREGQTVRVTVDSFPGETFAAHVSFVSRAAEFTPGNVQTPEERSKQVFRIKVAIDAGLDRLRPGMSADVWLGSEM